MITAHPKNLAIIVSTTFQSAYQSSSISRVGHSGVPLHLMCVKFAKCGFKSKDQILENSSLLFV